MMIPYVDVDGLRDYRADVARPRRRRWPWVVVVVIAGLALAWGVRP